MLHKQWCAGSNPCSQDWYEGIDRAEGRGIEFCQDTAIRKRRLGTDTDRFGITWKTDLNFTNKNEKAVTRKKRLDWS